MHAGQESPEEGSGPGNAEVLLRGVQRRVSRHQTELGGPHAGEPRADSRATQIFFSPVKYF